MYIRLIDKQKFTSPVLYIHNDEKEFLHEIESWRKDLLDWVDSLDWDGMPLARLEAETCMVDLLRHLTEYYVRSRPNCGGRIHATLKLLPGIPENEVIKEIKTYR